MRLWGKSALAEKTDGPGSDLALVPATGTFSIPEPMPVSIPYRRATTVPGVKRIWADGRRKPDPSPECHARELLAWLQGYPDVVGDLVPVCDLKEVYRDLCAKKRWKRYSWETVARRFGPLTGNVKPYRWVNGKKRLTYLIPLPA